MCVGVGGGSLLYLQYAGQELASSSCSVNVCPRKEQMLNSSGCLSLPHSHEIPNVWTLVPCWPGAGSIKGLSVKAE